MNRAKKKNTFNPNVEKNYYSVTQVGNLIGKSKQEVIEMCKEGIIKTEKSSGFRWSIPEEEYTRLSKTKGHLHNT